MTWHVPSQGLWCHPGQICNFSTPFPVWLGLGTEFPSEKIPRNRLGTVSVIPRKKVLIPRHSEFRGRANYEARNGTERNSTGKKYDSYCRHGRTVIYTLLVAVAKSKRALLPNLSYVKLSHSCFKRTWLKFIVQHTLIQPSQFA